MTVFDRIWTVVFILAVCAAAIAGLILSERAVAYAWRWVRFHLGRIRAEVAPLTPKEARDLLDIRRNCRRWADEPVRERQEGR